MSKLNTVIVTASPLELKALTFLKVDITSYEDPQAVEDAEERASEAEPAEQGVQVRLAPRDGQGEAPTEFAIKVRYRLPNEKPPVMPYAIDVEAVGLLAVADAFPVDERFDLARVNGASLVYGAIREMVANITCRQAYGEFWLPTLRFKPGPPRRTAPVSGAKAKRQSTRTKQVAPAKQTAPAQKTTRKKKS